jgi:hypothetical protein
MKGTEQKTKKECRALYLRRAMKLQWFGATFFPGMASFSWISASMWT